MLIEFPFNMIQFDWPMLIFVELLFALYLLINFLDVALRPSHDTVYPDFDWYENTTMSSVYALACFILLAIFFTIFWAFTIKCKLPSYAQRSQKKFEVMTQSNRKSSDDMCSVAETLDGDDQGYPRNTEVNKSISSHQSFSIYHDENLVGVGSEIKLQQDAGDQSPLLKYQNGPLLSRRDTRIS